jgi:RNA recognition motif-containing protein
MDQGAIPPQPIDAFDQQLLAQNQDAGNMYQNQDAGNMYQNQDAGNMYQNQGEAQGNPWEQAPMPMGPSGNMPQGGPMGFRGGPPMNGYRGQGGPMNFQGGYPGPMGPMGNMPQGGPMGFRGGPPPFGGPMGFQQFPYGQGPPMSQGQPCTTVWVGGLTDSTTEDDLTKFFGCFGTLDNVKLLPAKNCAFIRYNSIPEAIAAYHGMTNKIINGNQIRVGWGKTENNEGQGNNNNNNNNQGGSGGQEPCRNLYVGNVEGDITEEQLHREFSRFGTIEKIKIIPQKGCAFVTFHSLASALECRKRLHGTMMFGRPVKINFGKLSTEGIGQDNDSVNNVPVSDSNYLNIGPPQPPAPHDEKQKEVIDKFAASVVKNGPTFEDVVKEKQRNNTMFDFLNEGGLYAEYYRWKLFDLRRSMKEAEANPYQSIIHQATQVQQGPRFDFPPQQQHMGGMNHMMQQQHFQQQEQQQQGPPVSPRHIGLGLIGEERAALSQLLDSLVPTKDAIKKGKDYIVSLGQTASAVAEFMCERLEKTPDWSAKLNIIYLTNEVLHHCVKLRPSGANHDIFSEAFLPYLPAMLYSAYVNQPNDRREKIEKIIEIWKTKTVYDARTALDINQQINPKMQPQQNMGGNPGFGGNARGGPQNVASMLHELQHNTGGKFRNVSPPPFMGQHPMQQHAPMQSSMPDNSMGNLDSFLKSKKQEVLGDGRPQGHWDREPPRPQNFERDRGDRGDRDRGDRDRGDRDRGDRDRGRDDRDHDRKRGRDDGHDRSHSPQRRKY